MGRIFGLSGRIWKMELHRRCSRREGFNRDQAFGFYVIPSTFLIEDSLELVFRYELAEGEGRMLRPTAGNSRNIAPDAPLVTLTRSSPSMQASTITSVTSMPS